MNTVIVIPARYGSSRLPGKPLLRATGKYLVQHVYERACEAKANDVIVATDDERIVSAVQRFGGHVVLTKADHATGTDRVAEVVEKLDADIVINLQGDEPLIDPAVLDLLPELLAQDPDADMATVAVPFTSVEDWRNPNCVKVVCDRQSRALYFSRSPIPHVRGGEPTVDDFARRPYQFLLHVGLYAYRRRFLLRLAQKQPEPVEEYEKLEQLRVLALGCRIHVGVVRDASLGVDTLEDYERFVRLYRAGQRAA